MGGNSFRTVIRLVAGGYIMYLGYQIIVGYLHPTEETGDPAWYMLLFGIAFLIVGGLLLIDTIRKAVGAKKEAEEEKSEDDENDGQKEIEGAEAKELPDAESAEKTEVDGEAGAKADTEATVKASSEAAEEQPAPSAYPRSMSIAERIRRLSEEDEESETASAEAADSMGNAEDANDAAKADSANDAEAKCDANAAEFGGEKAQTEDVEAAKSEADTTNNK